MKRVDLATTTSLTTTYAGKFAGDYIRAAMYAMPSVEHMTVHENVDWKLVLKKFVDPITFAAQTCAFTPTGTITITERLLTLEWFQVHRELCKVDFINDWEVGEMGPGLDRLPPKLVDAVLENMMAGIAQQEEFNIWQGVNATTGQHDGLITLMLADAAVIDVASAVALTAANIVAEVTRLYVASLTSAQGPAVHGSAEKPEIYMGTAAGAYWALAQAALGNGFQYQSGDAIPNKFLGEYKINILPGMPANTMVIAQPSNLHFGTTLLNQKNNIVVADMGQWGEKNVRFAADFAFAVNYGFGDEITLYAYPGNS